MKLNEQYLDRLKPRTDKFDVLREALEKFHKKYRNGDKQFVRAIHTLKLLPYYRACVPTELLVSVVIERIPVLYSDVEKFNQMGFEDVKLFEILFGARFLSEFTINELINIEF